MTRYVSGCRVRCNIDEPETIQEKLMWLNIYDADPLKSDCADKLKVKEYAKRILGKDISLPTLKIWNSADEIDFDELPDKFVLKCNHGSGMNIIVKDKSQINQNNVRQQLAKWLSDDFAFKVGFESHYHWIERKIFAEELIDEGNGDLKDYKFWCFNGEPMFWTINDGNGHGNWMNFYDMDKNLLSYKRKDYPDEPSSKIEMPVCFDNLAKYSSKLSKAFKFVRIDFYEIDGKPFLGEMTFTPGAFIFKYKNPEDEIKVGNLLDISQKEQFIVSLTSFPERIMYASIAIDSLLSQKASVDYKVVLTLAEP